ncbi:hypothetical protein A1O3_02091 [Capronia epimyces CBS 606.96]|uniref:Uncharacterized protein n=1 Tax=Capronia epimyces CBS 606.96 TaxID=1182542 RepID=W9Y858_9EURO|nr:uncharacterized protein A1O3_02091 [Capronia epimyces CBS 606.96]EXJ89027.1 hypothetical protein A1O3_02091 [Capronia epimyces CBS 606.96]
MTPSHLLSRQFGGPPNDRGFTDAHRGFSTAAIVGIVLTAVFIALGISIVVFIYLRSRRRNVASHSNANPNILLQSQALFKNGQSQALSKNGQSASSTSASYTPLPGKSNAYGGSDGYQATPDQNHSLLGHAAAPAITVTWDTDHDHDHENAGIGSTQDGFGFGYPDATAAILRPIQRPPSIASLADIDTAPPPRYEEAAGLSSVRRPRASSESTGHGQGLDLLNRPFGVGVGVEQHQQRGRGGRASVARERSANESGSGNQSPRERSASESGNGNGNQSAADINRSVNADRRRSVSRFREVGMVDLDLDLAAKM